MWRKYNKNRSAANKVAYAEISRSCKNLQDQYAKDIERKVVAAGDLGTFYRYVNSKLSSRSGVAPLCTGDNTYITDTKSQANLLNTYFGSVCTSDNGIVPVCDVPAPVAPLLTNGKFTHKKIFHIMSNFKKSFAAGPDGLPPFFFKKMARSLAYPVAELCTLFFKNCSLPCIWKTAFVTPVFKKGRACAVENYRPISLTCVLCKVFESVVKQCLQDFLAEHSLLCTSQHGFVSKHSTCTNMLESLNDWTINIKNGNYTRVAFVDLAKAFDTVCHSKLILKLSWFGISRPLLNILNEFL